MENEEYTELENNENANASDQDTGGNVYVQEERSENTEPDSSKPETKEQAVKDGKPSSDSTETVKSILSNYALASEIIPDSAVFVINTRTSMD